MRFASLVMTGGLLLFSVDAYADEFQCGDESDNDQDGLVDCEDSDCADAESCFASCDDGIDNDEDLFVDCDDNDCCSDPACGESPPCFDDATPIRDPLACSQLPGPSHPGLGALGLVAVALLGRRLR